MTAPRHYDGARTQAWVRAFEAENGRCPTVLHIGNIANNAYNNAKLLEKVGFRCDVICPDYYHIMACPEWEDADFDEAVEDDFRPAWHRVDTRRLLATAVVRARTDGVVHTLSSCA